MIDGVTALISNHRTFRPWSSLFVQRADRIAKGEFDLMADCAVKS